MAEKEAEPKFVEVLCKSSGKTRRFAWGSDAGFALQVINSKLELGIPVALYIEAVKKGEEPVNFGPKSLLVDHGNGWKLQTVTEANYAGGTNGNVFRSVIKEVPYVKASEGSLPSKSTSTPIISPLYIGKIVVAFILMFVLGGVLTVALDNLPQLLQFITSSK